MPGHRLAAAIVCLAAASVAAAGNFSISPIRVQMDDAHRIQAFTLRNDDDAPVVIQVRTVAWTQMADAAQYHETDELLTTPPVFTVPAHGQQIVRVALRRAVDPGRELDYRLIFQEVPQAAARTPNTLSVALRLSVPVFVLPPVTAAPNLMWTAQRLPDGQWRIQADNRGNAHVQIFDFDLKTGVTATHVAVARYVLPGSSVDWTIAAPQAPPAATPETNPGEISIHGFSDAGAYHAVATRVDR